MGDLQRSGRIVYGYDLSSGDDDGVVTRGYAPNGTTRATLVVNSAGEAGFDMRREISAWFQLYTDQMK